MKVMCVSRKSSKNVSKIVQKHHLRRRHRVRLLNDKKTLTNYLQLLPVITVGYKMYHVIVCYNFHRFFNISYYWNKNEV